MNTRPRLFTRCLEPDEDLKKSLLEPTIIILSDLILGDERLRQKIKELANCKILCQSNPEHCLKLVNHGKTENYSIYLIASDRLTDSSRQILHKILSETKYIYFSDNISYNEQLVFNIRLSVCMNDTRFHTSLDRDIEGLIYPKLKSDATHCGKINEDASFIWYRFFFNLLDRLEHTNIAKREMMIRIRDIYDKYPYLNDNINEFEKNYHSDQSIPWYTKDTFLYRLINTTLRTGDINEIFSLRVIIRDLDSNLRMLHSQQVNVKVPCLFRGQQFHIDDIIKQKLSMGKFIAMDTFFSLSSDCLIAEKFSRTGAILNDPSFRSVLYKITIDPKCHKSIFANIESYSFNRQEKEWLFSLRSLFRIDNVKQTDDLCYINLTAVDEDDQEFCAAINPWKIVIGEQSFFSDHHQTLFFRNINSENEPFLAFQLFIDIILRLNQTEFAREEMIEMCRQKYANSPTDLKKIDEFEQTYHHEDAIKWYTTNTFLYRLLHRSLRTENIDTIFKMRYYIYDLHNQLAKRQISYIQSLPKDQSILTLYRGQRMELIDLEKLRKNVGNFISINSFLSTTNDYEAALLFSGNGLLDEITTEVSVIYQITIDIRIPHSIPFAEIQNRSIFKDEDEVLFSMASVFRVDAVELYGDLWIVDLTLVNKEDEQWNILTAHLNRKKDLALQ